MKVVIVGYGKAGQLHDRIFRQALGKQNSILVYDPNLRATISNSVTRISEPELRSINWSKEFLLDICTSNDQHIRWLEYAAANKIANVFVEKPLVSSFVELEKVEGIRFGSRQKIIVGYNYLHSPILRKIQSLLATLGLTPISLSTNFSKDRVRDSLQKRGADVSGLVPHNFFVEIPHQISLALALLGQVKNIVSAHCSDMISDNIMMKNHGTGYIELEHLGDRVSTHYSNLTDHEFTRQILVKTENNITIRGEFGHPPNYIGTVELSNGDDITFSSLIPDQSLKSFLEQSLAFYEERDANPCDLKLGASISKTIIEAVMKAQNCESPL